MTDEAVKEQNNWWFANLPLFWAQLPRIADRKRPITGCIVAANWV